MRTDFVEKISLSQFFLMIVIFQLGTAIVIGLGQSAKQDAWISVGIATIYGVLLIFAYCFMLSLLPGKGFYELLKIAYGSLLSRILLIFMCFIFFTSLLGSLEIFASSLRLRSIPKRRLRLFHFLLLLCAVIFYIKG
jgi:spore germination protein KB